MAVKRHRSIKNRTRLTDTHLAMPRYNLESKDIIIFIINHYRSCGRRQWVSTSTLQELVVYNAHSKRVVDYQIFRLSDPERNYYPRGHISGIRYAERQEDNKYKLIRAKNVGYISAYLRYRFNFKGGLLVTHSNNLPLPKCKRVSLDTYIRVVTNNKLNIRDFMDRSELNKHDNLEVGMILKIIERLRLNSE